MTTTVEYQLVILDDDIEAPIIEDIFYEDLIYDGDLFIPVSVNVSDLSGISSVSIIFESNVYEGNLVDETYYFALINPYELGTYSFTLVVEDNDSDYIGDSSIQICDYSFEIIDDDIEAPIISELIVDDPVYNNATSFTIGVNASDYSGIDYVGINFNGTIYQMTEVDGIYYATISMPTEIGIYSYDVIVNDADFDRPNDSLTTIETYTVNIEQGAITNIEITIDFVGFNLNSELGINMVFITNVNIQVGTQYSVLITISNGTLMYTYTEFGTIVPLIYTLNNYTINVELEISGQLFFASMTVELSEQDVKDLINQEIEELRDKIINSDDSDWRNNANIRKLIILFRLDLLSNFIEEDKDETAYAIMLIIKAKLTGELTDEYGDSVHGECIFVKTWVENEALNEEFLVDCNTILWALTLCF